MPTKMVNIRETFPKSSRFIMNRCPECKLDRRYAKLVSVGVNFRVLLFTACFFAQFGGELAEVLDRYL